MNIFEEVKSIHKYGSVISISSLILLMAGITPSLLTSDWTWFSRSGALLVIFGIFIIWIDYQNSVNKDLDTIFLGFKKHLTENTKESSESIEKIGSEVYKIKGVGVI